MPDDKNLGYLASSAIVTYLVTTDDNVNYTISVTLDGDNIQAYRTAMTRAPVPSLAWRTRTLEAMERTFPLPGLSILLR